MNPRLKAMLLNYAYAAISAVAALWTAGQRDTTTLVLAAVMALLAPAAQVLNPADKTAGIGSAVED